METRIKQLYDSSFCSIKPIFGDHGYVSVDVEQESEVFHLRGIRKDFNEINP